MALVGEPGTELVDSQPLESAHHPVRPVLAQPDRATHAVYAQHEPEVASSARFDPGEGVLHDHRVRRIGTVHDVEAGEEDVGRRLAP